MLTKLIEASKGWRDAWVSILNIQVTATTIFEELYQPIVGSSDGYGQPPVMSTPEQLERTSNLRAAYAELKTDLLDEVGMMDSRVIRPATDAKEYLQPIRKTIKKRENKRLDWERYTDKVNSLNKKLKRSDRDNAALARAEEDLAKAADDFKVADEHLQETLPPIIASAFSILPHLLAVQIMIQNTLLAQYYTILHKYCEENDFPSPPPPMEDVISMWSKDFKPVQQQMESINLIARGKAVHQPMSLGDDGQRKSITGLNVRNGIANRRTTSQNNTIHAVSPIPETRVMRIPSSNSLAVIEQNKAPSQSPSPEPSPAYLSPDYSTQHTPQSSYVAHSPAGPSGDYFQRGVAGKKKPPPPPPKRIGSQNSGVFAMALYSFEGQNKGDLSFKEGDQIKVVKKTDSVDDWWEGELRGIRGSFPANYCKIN